MVVGVEQTFLYATPSLFDFIVLKKWQLIHFNLGTGKKSTLSLETVQKVSAKPTLLDRSLQHPPPFPYSIFNVLLPFYDEMFPPNAFFFLVFLPFLQNFHENVLL